MSSEKKRSEYIHVFLSCKEQEERLNKPMPLVKLSLLGHLLRSPHFVN